MGSGARIDHRRIGDGWLVTIEGELNDHLDAKRLHEGLSGVVVFDLEKVTRVTSFGVREWLRGLAKIRAKYYCFINCRPAIVSQFNMIVGFGGVGELISLFLPYTCDECDREFEILADLRREYVNVVGGEPRRQVCVNCGAAAEFDDLPDHYFSHVKSSRPPNPPPAARAILGGQSSIPAVAPRITKRVHGVVTVVALAGDLGERLRLKRKLAGLEGRVVVDLRQVGTIPKRASADLRDLSDERPILSMHLTGVPLEGLQDIAAQFEPIEHRGIVSVMLPVPCGSCGSVRAVEISWADLDDLDVTSQLTTCVSCGGFVTGELSTFARQQLRKSLSNELPADIRHFVQARQSTAGSESWSGLRETQLQRLSAYRYETIRRIGSGGMAEVYLAIQRGPEGFRKDVVLKRILPHYISDRDFVAMFTREARIAAQISHPNVVQIFDLGQDADGFYIAMEYVEGWSLNAVLKRAVRAGGPPPVNIALRVVADLCAGLHGAHATTAPNGQLLGIVHCDISPHNVLVSSRGAIKIADFGVARATASREAEVRPDAVIGKISYLAPELITQGSKAAGPQSDVFAAGIVLYNMLTGRRLFKRGSDYDTLKAIISAPVPKLGKRDDVPERLEQILAKALARDVEQRFKSAGDLHRDLEELIVKLGRATTSSDVAKWARTIMKNESVDMAFSQDGSDEVPEATDRDLATRTAVSVRGEVSEKSKDG